MHEAQQPEELEQMTEAARRWMLSPQRYLRLREVASRRQLDLSMVIENVHDPHNVSAITRTADAVGINLVHLLYTREQFPRLNRAVSKGSHRWLTFSYSTIPEQLYARLRSAGYRIYATAIHPSARSIYELDFTQPSVVVVGNEHRGVSDESQALADERVFIPMLGMVESLNVSVATAVTLYEAMRQRREAGFYSREQPTAEQLALLEHWLERELSRRNKRNPVGKYRPH